MYIYIHIHSYTYGDEYQIPQPLTTTNVKRNYTISCNNHAAQPLQSTPRIESNFQILLRLTGQRIDPPNLAKLKYVTCNEIESNQPQKIWIVQHDSTLKMTSHLLTS